MKKTRVLAVLMGAALSMAAALPAYAGEWKFDGPESWKKWYREDDGSWTKNDWKQIDGKWYHFDDNGYLDVGWHYYEAKNEYGSWVEWFYLDDSGVWIENLTTDTGHMTPEGFQEDHCNVGVANNDDEDNVYWAAKIQEYGYANIMPSETITKEDGYTYEVLHFPYVDNAKDGSNLTGKTLVDCLAVAKARVGQVYPEFSQSCYWYLTDNEIVYEYMR
ncbi:Putative cell wall binding repeat-containing protein [[Clostridium] aminophilum]|uniref:Putative cell wall binding repeat-containing protein n=1 Tax=[Clostridium] aminophilum TaxID=1526 RepID=A0A1I0EMH6_9FIRM|nr:hypothetical protein [[Clostridium] aminophilum]SET46422.1 Putative cell wall binding repeat-containing protein [[Clostridium] aminophilum]